MGMAKNKNMRHQPKILLNLTNFQETREGNPSERARCHSGNGEQDLLTSSITTWVAAINSKKNNRNAVLVIVVALFTVVALFRIQLLCKTYTKLAGSCKVEQSHCHRTSHCKFASNQSQNRNKFATNQRTEISDWIRKTLLTWSSLSPISSSDNLTSDKSETRASNEL
jgi:hypothetical protein